VEGKIEALARRKQALNDLSLEVKHIVERSEPQRLSQMKEQFSEAGLTPISEKLCNQIRGKCERSNRFCQESRGEAIIDLQNGEPSMQDYSNIPPRLATDETAKRTR